MLSSILLRKGWPTLGWFGAVLILAQAPLVSAAKAKAGKATPPAAAEDVFTSNQVFRIQIEIPEAELKTLRQYRWGWGGPGGGQEKRPSVKATVREGGRTYTDVAIHLKGAAGSFQGVDEDPSLTLNFDKHVKGQTFHGLQRFSLNNSVQDRSLLNEKISRELFAKAGVPVPRAAHAKVELNGRDLGVHVLVEGANKQFLARFFKSANGNLYDGGFLKDVTDPLEKSSGKNPEDRSDLKRLADAAMDLNSTNRLSRLEKALDLDGFITYLAMDLIMCDWDGYTLNRNNYRIYHDPDTDKFTFIPHGLDQMFGVMRAGTDMPIFPRRMSGLVARAIWQTPQGRQRYRERVSQLMTNLYDVGAITNRLWEVAASIRPVLAEKGPGATRSYDQQVAAFARRIVQRAQSVRDQLGVPEQSIQFDTAGFARFTNWEARAGSGSPVLDRATEAGKNLLHIAAPNGSSVGVWFTKVRLAPGRYRLEGRVKTQGVTPDPGDRRGGAGLQTSRQRSLKKLTGTTGWTDFAFEFDLQDSPGGDFGFMSPIQDDSPDVELVCELRAAKGEAWFDLESLRLVRK